MRCIMTFKELQALIENNNIPHKKENHWIFTRFYGGRPIYTYNYEKDDNYIRIE